MSAGLFGLLDDVAALAKLAAASVDDIGAAAGRASIKSAGVVVDDTAVTPQYVHGVAAEREIPIIKRIAVGSLRNKLLMILPAILLLSEFLPGAITPLLMVGATYLCYEGAEKLWEAIAHRRHKDGAQADPPVTGSGEPTSSAEPPANEPAPGPAPAQEPEPAEEAEAPEDQVVSSAIRTDFILSSEIMVIALNEVADEPFVSRALILVVVALLITVLVYGVVGLIVKMDDAGLSLAERSSPVAQKIGRGLVKGMPALLKTLSVVGVAAMLWVGGHILLAGADDLGWHWPYEVVHDLEHDVHEATGALGDALGWVTNTFASAIAGLIVGAVAVAVMHLVPRRGRQAPGH